jgi:hypothetical protein
VSDAHAVVDYIDNGTFEQKSATWEDIALEAGVVKTVARPGGYMKECCHSVP